MSKNLFVLLLLFVSTELTLAIDFSGKDTIFKVYRLKVPNIDVSNFKSDDVIEYNTYPCQINIGCRWYSRPPSSTAPSFWNFVQEGVGHVIEHNFIDRNKGEFWLYFLPSDATGLKTSFAIILGKGKFFGLDEEIIYGDFGLKIVRNVVENYQILAKKGTIGGKPYYPYSKIFTFVKGLDFCSIKTKISSVSQFCDVCSNLETLYWQGEFELHSYFKEHLKELNLNQRDVSDKVNRQNPEDLEEDTDGLRNLLSIEEKRRVVKFKDDDDQQRTAYRVFDKYFTFDGLDQFLEDTRQKIQALYDQDDLKLPSFNKDELKKYLPPKTQEQKEREEKKKTKIKWEELYNIHAAQSSGYILLDQREVRNVEVCDLLTAHEKHRFLIHVKIGTDSSDLNHLFGQGYASACLMSQGEYPEEVFIKLVRERLCKEASTILDRAFTEARLNLWDEFENWRQTHQNKKGLLDNIEKSTDVENILEKVDKTSKTMNEAIKNLESIKVALDQDAQLLIEQVVATLKTTLELDNPFSQVEKILREKFLPKTVGIREKLIWESKDFPDKKEDFAEFCKALKDKKIKTQEENSAENISLKLEKYRKDILDKHIKKSFDKIANDLKVKKDDEDIESFLKSPLRDQLDKEIKHDERIKIILNKLKENYLSRKHQIDENKFKLVIEDKESLRYFQQLYEYILIPSVGNHILKVVFAIITEKDSKDPEFIPLGARINLIRTAENIRELNANKRGIVFTPTIMHITNINKKDKITQNSKKKDKKHNGFQKKTPKKRKRSEINSQRKRPAINSRSKLPGVGKSQKLNNGLAGAWKDLRVLFKEIKSPTNNIDVCLVQKLEYVDIVSGQTFKYLTCPTVGDGDCFFHAVFTDIGETTQDVKNKAAKMRVDLCDSIQQGNYLDSLKHLVYEHYKGLLAINENHFEVPENIRDLQREKNKYSLMYNSMTYFNVLSEDILKPEDRFPDDNFKDQIVAGNIKTYMERFRTVGGHETYIPARFPGIICPAEILALQGATRINIFTFNDTTKQLNYIKTAGQEGGVIDVLLHNDHFTRLCSLQNADNDNYRSQCEQIRTNRQSSFYK